VHGVLTGSRPSLHSQEVNNERIPRFASKVRKIEPWGLDALRSYWPETFGVVAETFAWSASVAV